MGSALLEDLWCCNFISLILEMVFAEEVLESCID